MPSKTNWAKTDERYYKQQHSKAFSALKRRIKGNKQAVKDYRYGRAGQRPRTKSEVRKFKAKLAVNAWSKYYGSLDVIMRTAMVNLVGAKPFEGDVFDQISSRRQVAGVKLEKARSMLNDNRRRQRPTVMEQVMQVVYEHDALLDAEEQSLTNSAAVNPYKGVFPNGESISSTLPKVQFCKKCGAKAWQDNELDDCICKVPNVRLLSAGVAWEVPVLFREPLPEAAAA